MNRPWPVITDRTAIDRARTAARLMMDACYSPNPPAAAEFLAENLRACGERWLTPLPDTAPDGRLSERDAGALVGKHGVTVRTWTNRGVIINGHRQYLARHPDGYDRTELLAFDAAMRTPYRQDDAA